MNSKHDSLVELVSEELRDRGFNVRNFHEYNNHGICGEIDTSGVKDKYCIVAEIKCSNNYKTYRKAKDQLQRAIKYCIPKYYRTFAFLVYWEDNKPKYEWIRLEEENGRHSKSYNTKA